MSRARGLGNTNFKIPDNPLYIDFQRSDGDQKTWPPNTTYVVDKDGHINWMKAMEISHPIAIKWRLAVGKAIAVDRGLEPSSNAVLRDWPSNYQMYDHHKGPAKGNIRHDIYLYGPHQRRFRSPMEFVPHAIWLCRDEAMNNENCRCKYCNRGVPQSIITGTVNSFMSMQGSANATSISAAGPSSSTQAAGIDIYSALKDEKWVPRDKDRDAVSLAKRRVQRENRIRQKGPAAAPRPKVFAAVQKPLKPLPTLDVSPNVLEQPMLPARDQDLRAVYSRSANEKLGVDSWDDSQGDPQLRRWFRKDEVVWVHLPDNGIPLSALGGNPDVRIDTWPGIVQGSKIKNTPVPVHNGPPGKPIIFPSNATLNGHSTDEPLRTPQLPATAPSFCATSPSHPLAATSNDPTATPLPNGSSSAHLTPIRTVPSHQSSSSATPFPPLPSRPGPRQCDWVVKESIIYTIQLMGVDLRIEQPAAAVLPYLGYLPGREFIDWMKENGVQDFDLDAVRCFDPVKSIAEGKGSLSGEEKVTMATTALSAYALALQAAARVCNDWTLTDQWDFEHESPGREMAKVHVVPSSSSQVAGGSQKMAAGSQAGSSLTSALEAAARSNAMALHDDREVDPDNLNLNTMTGTGPVYTDISGARSMNQHEINALATKVLGVGPRSINGASPSSSSSKGRDAQKSAVATQVRFQGMWWGSERIWADDFVRIKLARGAVAPEGAPNVYKPSGWGKKTAKGLEQLQNEKGKGREIDVGSFHKAINGGAKSKGVFMKVDSIFVVDVPHEDGKTKKEGRVAGMLYELAEVDWDETEPELSARLDAEKKEREFILKRQAEAEEATRGFKATVDEGLLPTIPSKNNFNAYHTMTSVPPGRYLIPQAPKGFRFRPILRTGYEAVLNLSLVSGRYYPRLLSHPLLEAKIRQNLEDPRLYMDKVEVEEKMKLLSLEGLFPGHFSSVDPTFFKKNRHHILDEAEQGAISDMVTHKVNLSQAEAMDEDEGEDGGDAMDDDAEGEGDEEEEDELNGYGESDAMNVDSHL